MERPLRGDTHGGCGGRAGENPPGAIPAGRPGPTQPERSTDPSCTRCFKRINGYLMRWLRKKYKRLKTFTKAHEGVETRLTSPVPGPPSRNGAVGYRALAVKR